MLEETILSKKYIYYLRAPQPNFLQRTARRKDGDVARDLEVAQQDLVQLFALLQTRQVALDPRCLQAQVIEANAVADRREIAAQVRVLAQVDCLNEGRQDRFEFNHVEVQLHTHEVQHNHLRQKQVHMRIE